jgi:hypothetical protein
LAPRTVVVPGKASLHQAASLHRDARVAETLKSSNYDVALPRARETLFPATPPWPQSFFGNSRDLFQFSLLEGVKATRDEECEQRTNPRHRTSVDRNNKQTNKSRLSIRMKTNAFAKDATSVSIKLFAAAFGTGLLLALPDQKPFTTNMKGNYEQPIR